MADETLDRTPDDLDQAYFSASSSSSRLNARAPEYVPRSGRPGRAGHHHHRPPPRMVPIHQNHGQPPPPVIHVFHPPPGGAFPAPVVVPFGGGFGDRDGVRRGGDGEGFGGGKLEEEDRRGEWDGLSEEVVHKVTKQVEYYFSDANLATTEHLMRFISKDPEGFVPIHVIASFKKIRALVNNNVQLATALRTSKKLVVSDDGKKVRRQQPITDSDLEELQARIIVAENLPEDHCYQSLVKVFSVVGSVKTIRTCYPQSTNAASPTNPRPGKIDIGLFNKLHAFVEYETADQAERAVVELNDEGNWRNGLRVRLLPSCMKHEQGRKVKNGNEDDENFDEDGPSHKQQNDKHPQPLDYHQQNDVTPEELGEEGQQSKDGAAKRFRGRGRGGRGRGRGSHNNNRSSGHPVGTPPGHPVQLEQQTATKQPPGPRMPDGTKGFTMGRGKPLETVIATTP